VWIESGAIFMLKSYFLGIFVGCDARMIASDMGDKIK
jgi:hypothetical protein